MTDSAPPVTIPLLQAVLRHDLCEVDAVLRKALHSEVVLIREVAAEAEKDFAPRCCSSRRKPAAIEAAIITNLPQSSR